MEMIVRLSLADGRQYERGCRDLRPEETRWQVSLFFALEADVGRALANRMCR